MAKSEAPVHIVYYFPYISSWIQGRSGHGATLSYHDYGDHTGNWLIYIKGCPKIKHKIELLSSRGCLSKNLQQRKPSITCMF